jgi:hypothetical protein
MFIASTRSNRRNYEPKLAVFQSSGYSAAPTALIEEHPMKKLTLTALACVFLSQAGFAAELSCDAKAAEKKLAGAAQTSFIKKCEKDAKASSAKMDCDAKAAEKKIYGAAKNSFTKKCITDAAK